jgi:hypothetical protein
MKEFLNSFMASNKKLQRLAAEELRVVFTDTIDHIRGALGDRAFRPERALNAAVYDAVMVGVAMRLRSSTQINPSRLREAYEELLLKAAFQEATTRATADKTAVDQRISLAVAAFSDV